jgi:hypothetical protein
MYPVWDLMVMTTTLRDSLEVISLREGLSCHFSGCGYVGQARIGVCLRGLDWMLTLCSVAAAFRTSSRRPII